MLNQSKWSTFEFAHKLDGGLEVIVGAGVEEVGGGQPVVLHSCCLENILYYLYVCVCVCFKVWAYLFVFHCIIEEIIMYI